MFILHMRLFFFLLTRLPPRSTLFPYTTLFRSWLLKNVNKIRLPLGQIQVFFQQKPILFYSYEAFFLPSGTHHQMTAVPNIEIGRAPSELQSRPHLVCRLLLEKKNKKTIQISHA